MAALYTVDNLVDQVKRIQEIPTNQSTFSEQDIVEMMTMELQASIVPLVIRVREEYFVEFQDVTVGPDNNEISIPPDTAGLRLRKVYFADDQGNLINVPRIDPQNIAGSNYTTPWNFVNAYGPGYYLRNNTLIFYPTLTIARTCRLMYFKRPANLGLDSSGGVVIAKQSLTNTITLDNAPTSWTAGDVLTAYEPDMPHEVAHDNISIVAKSGFDIDVSASDFAAIDIGDYINLKNYAQVVQYVPQEAYHLLVQGTSMRCLEALGDDRGYALAQVKYNRMVEDMIALLSPRTEGEPKKIINFNTVYRSVNRYRWGRLR